MARRLLMVFTSYKDESKMSILKFLRKLENEDTNNEYNIDVASIPVDEHNPVAVKYNVTSTPTFILFKKVDGKDEYEPIKRVCKNLTKEKLLEFIKE